MVYKSIHVLLPKIRLRNYFEISARNLIDFILITNSNLLYN